MLLEASDPESDCKITSMDSNQGGCPSVIRMPVLKYDEVQEQEHGENAMVLKAVEQGDKKELVESEPAQDQLDQGEPALDDLAQGKPAPEELAQVSVAQDATGAAEEGENKIEKMGEEASEGGSVPVDNGSRMEAGHGGSAQQQPQQEAAMPEGSRRLQAGAVQTMHRRPRFTRSQLNQLERLFKKTPYPSPSTRNILARWLGVTEDDVKVWFRNRRAISRRNNRMSMFSNVPPAAQNNDP